MTTFLQSVRQLLEKLDAAAATASRTTTVRGVHLHAPVPKNITINGVRRVGPSTTLLAVTRGWQRRGDTWYGSYITKVGTWDGKIEKRGDVFEPFIRNIPTAIRSHPKFVCFHQKPREWFWVHLHEQPRDQDVTANVSAIIAYMERLLAETLNKR